MRTTKFIVVALLSLTMFGCASTSAVKELADNHEILRGKLAAEPSLERGNERLFIYLKVESKVDGEAPKIYVCLAHNSESDNILVETKDNLLKAINEPVFIYANKQRGSFEEIVDGVDYYIVAVGYYMTSAQKYRIIQVGYGDGLRAAMADVKWSDFVKSIGKLALKTIKP